jgi:hypothetical protein
MSETSERRGVDRLRTNLEACWEGILARQSGTVVDISPAGCFILTRDDVMEKELIRLEVSSPTGRTIYLWGEVAYRVEEMGFALHFTGTDPTEHEVFLLLIDYLRWAQKAEQEGSAPVSCHVS